MLVRREEDRVVSYMYVSHVGRPILCNHAGGKCWELCGPFTVILPLGPPFYQLSQWLRNFKEPPSSMHCPGMRHCNADALSRLPVGSTTVSPAPPPSNDACKRELVTVMSWATPPGGCRVRECVYFAFT